MTAECEKDRILVNKSDSKMSEVRKKLTNQPLTLPTHGVSGWVTSESSSSAWTWSTLNGAFVLSAGAMLTSGLQHTQKRGDWKQHYQKELGILSLETRIPGDIIDVFRYWRAVILPRNCFFCVVLKVRNYKEIYFGSITVQSLRVLMQAGLGQGSGCHKSYRLGGCLLCPLGWGWGVAPCVHPAHIPARLSLLLCDACCHTAS